jgi:AhpD family alkylhydroperoxidase
MLWSEEYFKQLAPGVKEVGELSPDTVKQYIELSSAAHKRDLLGAKNRELIALVVAVTARWDGCITAHADAALRHGATRQEIAEALRVAAAVNAGVRQQKRAPHGESRALARDRQVSRVEAGLEIAAAPGILSDDAQPATDVARPTGDSSQTVVRPGMLGAPNP